ncbi:MAG: hypothetical protein IPP76_08265 [Moraxellaceae bacterium]|nr:hypothetical protein [Moraxellaceae bacterium]
MKKSNLPTYFPHAVVAISVLVIYGVVSTMNIWLLGAIIFCSLFAYYLYVNSLPTYSQNAADSIYYFGFSLTIITLATSAIYHFGSKQNIENLSLVFSQFGIGLIATCAGLLLRLMIVAKLDVQNHVSTVEEEETARRQLISDLGTLRLEVVGFAEQLKELNKDLHQQQKVLHQQTVNELKELTQNTIQATKEASIKAISDIDRATVSSQQLQQTFFTESLSILKQTILETNDNLKELSNKTYQQINSLDFTGVSNKTNQAISTLGSSIESFASQTINATTHLNNTSTELAKFTTTISAYQTQISNLSPSLQSITQAITSHATSTERHLKSSEDLLSKMNTQHQQYIDVYNKYEQANEDAIQKTTKAVDTVANALTQVANEAVQKLK